MQNNSNKLAPVMKEVVQAKKIRKIRLHLLKKRVESVRRSVRLKTK